MVSTSWWVVMHTYAMKSTFQRFDKYFSLPRQRLASFFCRPLGKEERQDGRAAMQDRIFFAKKVNGLSYVIIGQPAMKLFLDRPSP
jgi:hypothetical protein